MIRRRTLFATVAAVALALLVPVAPVSAADPYSDWITVDRALVNKLGGVSVSGEVSCPGTYELLMAGQLEAMTQDEQGHDVWYTVEVPGTEDRVNIFVNADNYIVSQPAGRRTMIQVKHESSRMNPCFAQWQYDEEGTPWSELSVVECRDEAVCRWETDRFAYDRVTLGPLFDYSPDGKFKSGDLNVDVTTYGSMIAIYDTLTQTWEYHGVPYQPDLFTQTVVRATMYR